MPKSPLLCVCVCVGEVVFPHTWLLPHNTTDIQKGLMDHFSPTVSRSVPSSRHPGTLSALQMGPIAMVTSAPDKQMNRLCLTISSFLQDG